MRIAVIDSVDADRRLTVQMIEKCTHEHKANNSITETMEFVDYAQITNAFQHIKFNGVFITVENIYDIETVLKLSSLDKNCPIVFVSSVDSFSIIGYRLKAIHYLKKPIEISQVQEALKRCQEQ